ncbi:MAG: PEGA domain-containing protein, partial [Gammaproteobacteria bacterium]|nr:PEGA domain-containing protein [Gammaproteobacteria bacterium]
DNQTARYALTPLPGLIDFITTPIGASVEVDGQLIGSTPLIGVEIAAGERHIAIKAPRYLAHEIDLEVTGRNVVQRVEYTMLPNWAPVSVSTAPAGARVFVDEIDVGMTPGTSNSKPAAGSSA